MQWRMPLLSVTIELILHTLKVLTLVTKVLMLVLILDLHYVVVPQLLQIFNHRPEISVDLIPRLL
jgi:hypothetical protein